MAASRVTVLTDSAVVELADFDLRDGDLWVTHDSLRAATGFELKPEGLCRGDLCFPLPRGRENEFSRDNSVNLAAFWRYRGGPVISSRPGDVWVFGDPPPERAARLASLEAPDFTLPDSAGHLHSLSDFRGKKVLLATWASW